MKNKKMKIIIKKSDFQERLLFFWLLDVIFMTIARFLLSNLGFSSGTLRNIILIIVASIPLVLFFIHIKSLKVELDIPVR